MPKQLQILCGIFPIAQVREPFSAIQYMAKYVPIENVYKLKLEDAKDTIKYNPEKGELPWSAWMICEAYANKRGYHTRRGLDVHRAGLEILFDVIDGRVVLYFLPNQTSLNLGAFQEPDSKIVQPLLPKSDSELPLPEQSSSSPTSSTESGTETGESGSSNKRGKAVAVARARSTQNPPQESHGGADSSNGSEGDENQEEEAEDDMGAQIGSNPFDVLG
jgi:hypothetical protein